MEYVVNRVSVNMTVDPPNVCKIVSLKVRNKSTLSKNCCQTCLINKINNDNHHHHHHHHIIIIIKIIIIIIITKTIIVIIIIIIVVIIVHLYYSNVCLFGG